MIDAAYISSQILREYNLAVSSPRELLLKCSWNEIIGLLNNSRLNKQNTDDTNNNSQKQKGKKVVVVNNFGDMWD